MDRVLVILLAGAILAGAVFTVYSVNKFVNDSREEIEALKEEIVALDAAAARADAAVAAAVAIQEAERLRREAAEEEISRLRAERGRLRKELGDVRSAISGETDAALVVRLEIVVGVSEISLGAEPWRFRLTRIAAERAAATFEEARAFSLIAEKYEAEVAEMTTVISTLRVELAEEGKKMLIERAIRDQAVETAKRATAVAEGLERANRREKRKAYIVGAVIGAGAFALLSR